MSKEWLASMAMVLSIFFCGLNSTEAQNLDERILKSINPRQNFRGNPVLQSLNNTADYVAVATPLAMLGVAFATQDKELKTKGLSASIAILGTYGVAYILKETVKRPRPWDGGGFQSYQQDDGYSFPSGGTSVAFASATSLTTAFPKWYVAVPAYGYAAGVGFSRMKLGAHYPSDVLAGAFLGTASVFVSKKLTQWIRKK